MEIKITEDIAAIFERFASSDYEAFLVGGCVRDALMGLTPHDYDFTTNATPQQVHEIFSDYHIIDTGIKHGTVTLLVNHEPYEITTYRKETGYDDHRHPNSVSYSQTLYEDLVRRDFTINAMAYSPESGLVDYFGGVSDLNNGILRCVGVRDERFEEDALRILRALRFAGRLNLKIEEETEKALFSKAGLLRYVSVERIAAEFNEILCCENAEYYLDRYRDIIAVFLPEITVMFDFDHNSRYHCYDIWHHTLKVVENVPQEPIIRWTALLHDSGKPVVAQEGKDGHLHYIGHAEQSYRIATEVMERLHYDNKTSKAVCRLVREHDYMFNNDGKIRMLLSKYDLEFVTRLIQLQRADNLAHAPEFIRDDAIYDELLRKAEEFSHDILHLSDLRIDGNDLKEIGITGPSIGYCLDRALKMVLQGKIANQREELLKYVSSLKLSK